MHSSFIDKISNHGHNEEPSYFLSYFLLVSIVAIAAYLVFHNKQKVFDAIGDSLRLDLTRCFFFRFLPSSSRGVEVGSPREGDARPRPNIESSTIISKRRWDLAQRYF